MELAEQEEKQVNWTKQWDKSVEGRESLTE